MSSPQQQPLLHPVASAQDAAACYRQHGVFWMRDVLTPGEVTKLAAAAGDRFHEALRALLVAQSDSVEAGSQPPSRFAEILQKDGGRYDCRHGMDAEPFATFLRAGGAACSIIPSLEAALGEDAEVATVGQITAMSRAATLKTFQGVHGMSPPENEEAFGDQAWHIDGSPSDSTRSEALTLFVTLCDTTPQNGATQFILGSHTDSAGAALTDAEREARATTLYMPAGSAVAFSTQLWHRGLRNKDTVARPIIYAIVSKPIWVGSEKMLPVLSGASTSVFTGRDVEPTLPFRLGSPIPEAEYLEVDLELPDDEEEPEGHVSDASESSTSSLRQGLLDKMQLSLTQQLPACGPFSKSFMTTLRVLLLERHQLLSLSSSCENDLLAPINKNIDLGVCQMLKSILAGLEQGLAEQEQMADAAGMEQAVQLRRVLQNSFVNISILEAKIAAEEELREGAGSSGGSRKRTFADVAGDAK
eukprot:TRINITY_DN40755_c0_g1_i1.p1 TRINITY_DN40755_c0_g1~~TRINITY_DN40755_c0_g1_i1.p1  ORF type:complete len:494 (-),score=111.01 TRINITY_DN40755_c0_g1_i1:9-1427(-)